MAKPKLIEQLEALQAEYATYREDATKTIKALTQENVEINSAFDSYKEEAVKQINKLTLSNGGYKTSNENYRKKIEAYKENFTNEHNNALERIAELKKELEQARNEIKGYKAMVKDTNDEMAVFEANLEFLKTLPWWKRILPLSRYV